jgi:speckle-type POZ protein
MCTTRYWPNWGADDWIKISVVITRTDRRQRHKVLVVHIDLLGKTGLPVPPCFMHIKREPIPASSDDCEGGVSLIVSSDRVERYCVVDGHFTVLCTVAVSRAWPPPLLPTPAALGRDVSMVPDLVDVSFQVEGKTFDAHRLVLAARSLVFKAELFGQMAESKARYITIQDARAPTFKFMLDYMYHGLLPAATPEMDDASQKMEFQHLYVAACRQVQFGRPEGDVRGGAVF